MSLVHERRTRTNERLEKLAEGLGEAKATLADKGCVYLTGSAARGELGKHSDLDLFILGKGEPRKNEIREKRELTHLDEIIIQADLIKQTSAQDFPPFSGDGEYLTHHLVASLRTGLGQREDDYSNTFTARLLLLLESRPLLGEQVYQLAIDEVLSSYWRDYPDHKSDFVPTFLTNDILRLWKTFCVNYEARTKDDPARERAERKLKNYKLKHSRVLTCYSAILYLAQTYKEKSSVHPRDAQEMIKLVPSARLEWLGQRDVSVSVKVSNLLGRYEEFLAVTDAQKETLIERFSDRSEAKSLLGRANDFGNDLFELVQSVSPRKFFRYLVV